MYATIHANDERRGLEHDSHNDAQSIDSQDEALCEMLGLTSFHQIETVTTIHADDEDDDDDEQIELHLTDAIIQTEDCKEMPSLHVKPERHTATTKFNIATAHRHPVKEGNTPRTHPIILPHNVSRHFHAPHNCLALEIPNLLTPAECQELIALAGTVGSGFGYIRSATHTAPDGSHYRVDLQNPNPHKLSVFAHAPWVHLLWSRLQPILMGSNANTSFYCNKDDNKSVLAGDNSSSSCVLSHFLQREGVSPPTRLNPRLRVLQYDATDDDEFAPHFDATTRIDDEISLLTVLLYLNNGSTDNTMATSTTTATTTSTQADFAGGETYFLNTAAVDQNPTVVTPRAGTVVVFEHDLFHCGRPLVRGTKYVLRTDILFAMSDEDWEQRAALAAQQQKDLNCQGVKSTTSSKTSTGSGNNHEDTPPSTVRDLAVRLKWTDAELQGLECLDMADMSVASFCVPGRFALRAMLQDVIPRTSAIVQIVDAAFDLIRDQ